MAAFNGGTGPQSTEFSIFNQTKKELSVAVPWGTMAAKSWNSECTKIIIGIHGWQDNANSFDKLIPLLPKGIRYIILDLPGHGKSSYFPPGTMYEMQRYIMSLHFFVKGLKLDKFSLMGHSLGGAVCCLYSGTFPNNVYELIILESICAASGEPERLVNLFSEGLDSFVKGEFRTAKPYPSIDAAVERLKLANNSLTDDAAKILIDRGTVKSENGYLFVRDPVLYQSTLRMAREVQLEIVSRIKAKTLIVLAEDGFILKGVDAAVLARLLEAYKKSTSLYKQVTVPGKHHIHLTDPESISQIICDFLNDSVEDSS
ncbi:uncharacterized protein TRIADDRAFT_56446 [Trichoplax adhaerens]|uniref:AB hydrolase-1 domain-containing protein n=1 Tax=Trichoplax adhaerens TaxID=10228 RepID=B3RY59_TRIAD|nr:hypothetical protein TRIADDRAFT_56446 [Trichoplax adhaerens]EDV24979.1 hypothetical protein TRIADDRAFT_56446 [Trichoplax adhaerens]|eukprot:XP_002112869.1 hypothetical protein TRIADDRAFT_56446 [Trichoplax adhaerens]